MAGGRGSLQDDWRVGKGEKVWRLIPLHWYRSDPATPNGPKQVQEQAFGGDMSVLRQALVANLVDTAYGGQFQNFGILEFEADELRRLGLVFEYEHDDQWGADAHFLLRRVGSSKLQRLNQTQKGGLARIANSKPLLREPK